MHDSADKIGGVVYDANGHNDDYGFGRVNAEAAVQLAADSIAPVYRGKDIALVRQMPGWGASRLRSRMATATWNVTNGPVADFITSWAKQPGVRVVAGDFNGNGLTDIALVRQTPGWGASRWRSPMATATGRSPTARWPTSSPSGPARPACGW